MQKLTHKKYDAVVFTEGKTDWRHLEIAAKVLQFSPAIKFERNDESRGDTKLLDLCETYSKSPIQNEIPLIFIFDRDNRSILDKVLEQGKDFKEWQNNVYSLALPIPTHRQDKTHFSIEFFYKDSDLKKTDSNGRRIYTSDEFNERSGTLNTNAEVHLGNFNKLRDVTNIAKSKIIDNEVFNSKHENIALSKSDFANYIYEENEIFNKIDFSEFQKILDLINSIICSAVKFELNEQDCTNDLNPRTKRASHNDRPPIVPIFIGRNNYIEKIQTPKIRIIAITGLGGEGKSTLASHFYQLAKNDETIKKFENYGWCDCKELETPFHDKLHGLLEYLSKEVDMKEKFAEESANETIDRFIDFLNTSENLIVFDNVDAFIEKDSSTLLGNMKDLFDKILNRVNKGLIIFTSRAPITDFHFSFLEIPIQGLTYPEVIELAKAYGLFGNEINESLMEVIYDKTKGHALLLNLIFAQLRNGRLNISRISEIFSIESQLLDKNLLRSIWNNLNEKEKDVVWIIATFNRPPNIKKIEKVFDKSYQKTIKVINTLTKLRLVLEFDIGGEIHYGLHPIIQMKATDEFKPQKKEHITNRIITILSFGNWKLISSIAETNEDYISDFEGYVECAEIALRDADHKKAIDYLCYLSEALRKFGQDAKYIQLCADLFHNLDHKEYRIGTHDNLSKVFEIYLKTLLEQGEFDFVNSVLQELSMNIQSMKEYIYYIEMQGYSLWFQNRFEEHIKLYEDALIKIKEKNEIVSTNFEYDYYLSKRDAGFAKDSLNYFIEKEGLNVENWDPNSKTDLSSVSGNISRCYYLLGDYDKSIHFLNKSIMYLAKDKSRDGRVNYGYALLWLADINIKKKKYEEAHDNLIHAIEIWSKYCPSRIKKIEKHISNYPASFNNKFVIDPYYILKRIDFLT